jgi:hypothetical protein
MRSEILGAITTNISTLTQFAVATELPWSQNDQPLYRKNMKKIYVDRDILEETTLLATLDNTDVMQNDLIVSAYLAVDAKNTPSQLDGVVSKILDSKDSVSLVNFGFESDYTVEKDEDVIVYTFEFRMNTIK